MEKKRGGGGGGTTFSYLQIMVLDKGDIFPNVNYYDT